MLSVLSEVSIGNIIRFLIYELWNIGFSLMILPPMRSFWLMFGGAKIGKQSIIHRIKVINMYSSGLSNLAIGDRCFLGDEVLIDVSGKVTLEDHVTIAMRACIVSHMNVGFFDHPLRIHYPKQMEQVRIRRGSFIGANATILPGVTIGELALVAAGSVVTHDVSDRTCAAGVPARIFKRLPDAQ